MPRKRYTPAITEALHEEMARDDNIILFGEDVELAIFGDTRGLYEKFGPTRIRNTPICEATLAGMAVGAAAAGHRVILHLLFSNFVYTAFDAIANQMGKLRLMTGGQINLPITVLAVYGGGGSNAAQHSDSAHPVLMNVGGINVVMPSTPADAKGLLKTAIRGNQPTFFMMAAALGGSAGEVPDGDYTVPFGKAEVIQPGNDLTIVTIGSMFRVAQAAAKALSDEGHSIEIVDARSLVPLDEEGILRSVRKTGRLVVVDEARLRCSAASEIAAMVGERAFADLKGPVRRVAVPNVSMPYAPNAERAVYPNAEGVARVARELLATKEAMAS